MELFRQIEDYGHEEIVFGKDEKTGLRAIVAIHSTVLGPAVGGTRFFDYATEKDALYDVLRLSRSMSLKNAAAGLKMGGGKAVIIGDPQKLKSTELFHAYGRIINSLGGRYYTAEDVNMGTADIDRISEITPYVTGTHAICGNPSPFTARGVYMGMKAGAKVKFGSDSLRGLTIAVQGLGSVGYRLCELLHWEGAKLKVFDINQRAVNRAVFVLGAESVSGGEILTTPCDIFAPCALGNVLNTENVRSLKCKMVCGAANNVLANAETGDELMSLGILYLPDYIVNAGGIINCEPEVFGYTYDPEAVTERVDDIYNTALKIIAFAKDKNISTYAAADLYAASIINAARCNAVLYN